MIFDFTLYVAGFASFLTATTILLTQNLTAIMTNIISVVGVALVLRMVDKPKLQDNGCIRSCFLNSGQRAWGFDSPTQHQFSYMDRYEIKQNADEQLKQKQLFQLEEIKYLRSDLLQTRADLQRTIVYTFALATIISTLVTKLSDFANGSYLYFILLITSILFFMLSLNYIGNMRHYLNVARYLETKCKELSDSFDLLYDNNKTFELLNWEIYNRDFYKKGFSKIILGLTWGVQPFYPTFFGLVSFLIAISKFSFVEMKCNAILLLLTLLPIFLLIASIASMVKALIEIKKDIKLANKYSRYSFNRSK